MAESPHSVNANPFRRSNYAPTPKEEAMITALLAKEEQSLARLNETMQECKQSQERSRRVVEMLQKRISAANSRMCIASQLRDRIWNGLESAREVEVPKCQSSTSSLGEEDEESTYHQQELTSIRNIYETMIHGTLKQLEDIDILLKRQAETAELAQKELESALFIESIGQTTLESTVVQQEILLTSMHSKKSLFRPIWRVPLEIWTQIFRATAFQSPSLTTEFDWHTSSKPWRQPFTLSGVCYQWRVLCRTDPIMWKNVVIILQNEERSSLSDFQTHCSLSRGMLESLTLVTRDINPLEPYTLLKEQFSTIKELKILNCDATGNEDYSIPTIDWWPTLPPVFELHICEFGINEHSSGTLPPRFATSIRTVICKGVLLEFLHPMPCLEELVIDIDPGEGRYPEIPGMIPALRASHGSLRKLHITANIEMRGDANHEPVTLENLEEVTLNFWDLVDCFSAAFLYPSLRRVSIIDSNMSEVERNEWERFFMRGDPSNTIKYFSLSSINCDEAQNMIPFVSMMRRLDTLSLKGESVEPMIQARTSAITAGTITDYDNNNERSLPCFSTIQTLDIHSYTGTGEVVLQYIEAVQQANALGHVTGQSELKTVTFDDCPNVTETMKASIQTHLEVC